MKSVAETHDRRSSTTQLSYKLPIPKSRRLFRWRGSCLLQVQSVVSVYGLAIFDFSKHQNSSLLSLPLSSKTDNNAEATSPEIVLKPAEILTTIIVEAVVVTNLAAIQEEAAAMAARADRAVNVIPAAGEQLFISF